MLSQSRHIQSPIIILGAPRSGTTLLGKLIAAHPDVAYWEEPRTVWSTGNQQLPDDVLTPEHLSQKTADQIDQRFADFLTKSGKTRFAEKTPCNLLRIPFIHALYPDAKFIYIHRDPYSVIASALRMLETPPDLNRITARIREARLRDYPNLLSLFVRDTLARRFNHGKKPFWGPRPPEWQTWQKLPPATMLSKQWLALTQSANHDLQQLPNNCWMQINYPDLIEKPEQTLPQILDFSELSPSPSVTDLAKKIIHLQNPEAWRKQLSPEQIQQIEEQIR
ncbi:MAG: sulfotransferase [Verrucomicrobiales bacterium]|nr:sulfotransferase [Verrucomicrobiales bacterium]